MRKLKVLLTGLSLLALVACGSDSKSARKKAPKVDPNGVTNTNNGSQNGNAEEIPAPSGTATYQSHDGLYTATLVRDGERYAVSISRTYLQSLALNTTDKSVYSVSTPNGRGGTLDEIILSKQANNVCNIVWKEYGYGTYDRIFQGPCP